MVSLFLARWDSYLRATGFAGDKLQVDRDVYQFFDHLPKRPRPA